MLLSERIGIGMRGLLLRRMRSLLSTLGIVFGVAAVIAMMSIGEGARQEAVEQIKLLGTNNIRVRQLELTGDRRDEAERKASRGLTYEDASAIEQRFGAQVTLAPMRFVDAEVRREGSQGLAQVVGTTAAHEAVTGFRTRFGRFVTDLDVRGVKKVCVLGAEIKQDLFGPLAALGQQVRIGANWFTVIGVMESRRFREGKGGVIKVRNINRDVYIPITAALARFHNPRGASAIDEIAVRVADGDALSAMALRVRALLQARHRSAEDFEIMVPEELLAQAQRTQRMFNIIMGSIAGISLLVGGIGIMNIMLANVSERTREIGIRRAIGATQEDVLSQFLIETVTICLAGGGVGVLFGVILAKSITLLAGWQTGFSALSVLIALGTSAAVGLGFGMVPARRAAQLRPVQAIRNE